MRFLVAGSLSVFAGCLLIASVQDENLIQSGVAALFRVEKRNDSHAHSGTIEEVATTIEGNKKSKNGSLRRMVYRVADEMPDASDSHSSNLVPMNSNGDTVYEEDVRYWTRVLQQSNEGAPVKKPKNAKPVKLKRGSSGGGSSSTYAKTNSNFSGSSGFMCKYFGNCRSGPGGYSTYRKSSSYKSYGSYKTYGGYGSRYKYSNYKYGSGKGGYSSSRYKYSNYNYGSYGGKKGGGSYSSGGKWGKRKLSVQEDPSIAHAKFGGVRRRHSEHPRELIQVMPSENRNAQLDFFVAGFPKCGTTTLLYAFKKHRETVIGEREQCDITLPNLSDQKAFSKLNKALAELPVDEASSVKTAIKCPVGIKRFQAIERLSRHSPNASMVIGVRHPVLYFQSFYNYRVTEMYEKGIEKDERIPSVEELIGSREWKGVSTDTARFELFLMQLGKTSMSVADMQELSSRPNMAVMPSGFKVFLYSLEQLEDTDAVRANKFRRAMESFLHLEEPLDPFERKNTNHLNFTETIDICNAEYNHVRALLLSQGKKTQEWIQNQFLLSDDVFVGEKEHFMELLQTWGSDPCLNRSQVVTSQES